MLTGGCFCGHVRYAADAPAFHETVCHCTDCRRAVGAAPVAWFSVPRAALRFTAGESASFRSSAQVTRRFCGRCGTSLTYESDRHPDEVDVTICSLDDPNALPPKDHVQVATKLHWTLLCDGLPAYDGWRPEAVHAFTDNVLVSTPACVLFAFATPVFARGRLEGGPARRQACRSHYEV